MPKNLQFEIDKMPENSRIKVFGVKLLKKDEVVDGVYAHLHIEAGGTDSGITFPETVVPEIRGKYSKYNVQDKEIKRKDLPMEQYSISFDAPNFGDESKGTHEVTWDKERYQREIIPAKGFLISVKLIDPNKEIFEFEIDRTFSSADEDLFYAINLLQEATGVVNVRSSEEEVDYSQFEGVTWEFFPPEKRETILNRILSGKKIDETQREVYGERVDYLASLKPIRMMYGTTGLGYYVGALLREDLVVFENFGYGNAVYVMFEEWEELSRLSRTELLRRPSLNYERAVHDHNWKKRVGIIIRSHGWKY